MKEVDPNEQLDEEVENMLLQIADDFIEQVGHIKPPFLLSLKAHHYKNCSCKREDQINKS